jgi:bifunctional DNase/RNase
MIQDRFTSRTMRALLLAQEEAKLLNHDDIGTEHILLGLIGEGGGVAARALKSLGISQEAARQQVEELTGRGQQEPSGDIGLTAHARTILAEQSVLEYMQLNDGYVGTEHILLGLTAESDGVAAQVLVNLGADLNQVRHQVVQLLNGHPGTQPESAASPLTDTGKALPVAVRGKGIGSRLSAARRVMTRPGTGEPDQPPGTAQMTLAGVRVEVPSKKPIVLLKEAQGDRYLPIWIGEVEATAIAFAQQGMKTARPLTHDLFADVLKAADIRLLNVTISSVDMDISNAKGGLFNAHLSLSNHTTVSCRPSDGIALAIRTGTPILASDDLLNETGVSIPDDVP